MTSWPVVAAVLAVLALVAIMPPLLSLHATAGGRIRVRLTWAGKLACLAAAGAALALLYYQHAPAIVAA